MNIIFRISALVIGLYITVCATGCGDDDTATEAKDFPREGLVAYYPFNGNANDESDENNNGTVNGATLTTDRYGNANKAYAFDGTDDYIDCGNGKSLQITESITICAWVKANILSGDPSFVAKYASGGFNFAVLGSHFRWNIGISDSESSSLSTDKWTFLTATYNGSVSKMYLDGILKESVDVTGSIGNPSVNLTIGSFGTLGGYFAGSIDDVMIYNRALSADEITEVYNQTITK